MMFASQHTEQQDSDCWGRRTFIPRNLAFFAGSLLAVLLALTVYDEDVLTVEHVLSAITVLGMLVAVSRALIPDEHMVWCPERLMTSILAQIHYMPDHWKGQCHTYSVRDQFAHLFQYKAVHLVEELLSPLVTPVVLCCFLRHRALDIVDFLRNFTVEVVGVGDVCSFAQMDIRKHGCPQWTTPEVPVDTSEQHQAQHGKTELSLMHFTLTNPKWVPPEQATAFLSNLKGQVTRDASKLPTLREDNPLYHSLNSLTSLGGGYSELVSSVLRTTGGDGAMATSRMAMSDTLSDQRVRGGLSHTEGPLGPPNQGGLLASFQADPCMSLAAVNTEVSLESTAAHMSFSTLYMHELHQRQLRRPQPVHRLHVEGSDAHSRLLWQRGPQVGDLPHILESPQEGDQVGLDPRQKGP